jgi:hypothetical protein
MDNDGNGRFGAGDEPVANVQLLGAERPAVTDANGRVLLTGLGSAPSGQLVVSLKDIDRFSVDSPPALIKYAPRPGNVMNVEYPLRPTGELYLRLLIAKRPGELGLAGVRVLLRGEKGEPLEGVTEYDGSLYLDNVPLGKYSVELDPAQATRLKMRLQDLIRIEVRADSYLEIKARVEFAIDANLSWLRPSGAWRRTPLSLAG